MSPANDPGVEATKRFAEIAPTLTRSEGIMVTLLAINEPVNISLWCDTCRAAGIRESPTRTLSTTSLRPHVQSLIERGLVRVTREGKYRVTMLLRTLVLRWAAERPDFALLARISPNAYQPDQAAIVALHAHAPNAVALFEQLLRSSPEHARRLALEVTSPFDDAWLRGQGEPLRTRLLELSMVGLEKSALDVGGPYPFFAADPSPLDGASQTTLSAFAGIAVLRGDFDVLRTLAVQSVAAPLAPLIRGALAMVEGRYDDAASEAELVSEPRRNDHFGVLALLHVMALRIKQPASERAKRVIALGAKKNGPFEDTFRIQQDISVAEGASAPSISGRGRVRDGDCTTILWDAMRMRVAPAFDFGLAPLVHELSRYAEWAAEGGYAWLSEQCHLAASLLYNAVPKRDREFVPKIGPLGRAPLGPSLLNARTQRAPWEIALDRLDNLTVRASAGATEATPTAPDERIIWRTFHDRGSIEPFFQKRSPGGKWTAGRKLAIKHLIGKTPTAANLPPEDLRIAHYAREERSYSGGYPVVSHHIDQKAWLSLVGHPRVHVGDSDSPTPVVRGEPKLSAQSDGDSLVVAVEPSDLRRGVQARRQDGQLVVYDIDGPLHTILDVIGKGLKVPASGKERLLAMLERMASLVTVESAVGTSAKRVAADATPCFRLVPSAGGLSVALVVRPLGAAGPSLQPGRGATTLLGVVGGEATQTERDLALESRLAEEAVIACPVLGDAASSDNRWLLGDPEACLELVSALSSLGGNVLVEWPQGTPLRLRSKLSRKSLIGKLRRESDWFTLDARLTVDGELSMELSQLLELLAEHPGRFVRLASGEYVELEHELREVLESIAAARVETTSAKQRTAIPTSAVSVLSLLTNEGGGLSFDTKTEAWRERFQSVFSKRLSVPKGLEGELRDYQVEGFRWLTRLAELELGACLADDMGLGKTVQLIALLLHRASSGPALVVAPTSVCENWRREIERFAPSLDIRMFAKGDRDQTLRDLGRRDVVITSYAMLQQETERLQAIDWSTAVLDEAQLIKNPETQRAKAAFGLRAKARIVATGTPVENHAGDLYSLFHYLNPGLLGSWKSFAARVSGESPSSSRAHKRLIQPFVLRRTKAQVLDDLPPLTEIQRNVQMSPGEAKLYESVRKAALSKLGAGAKAGQARIQIFAELTRLRRLCCHPALVAPGTSLPSSKLESFLELVEELVEGRHRALVFSQFTDVLALVRPLLDAKKIRYQYLDGSTPTSARAAAVDAFQAGEGDVFLISLKAGGFGLNLTAADYVIHLDPWWNPAVEAQAGARAHRMGQSRPVTVYRLVTEGTIESRIVELHREKRDLAEALLSETDRAGKLSAQELRSLLDGP